MGPENCGEGGLYDLMPILNERTAERLVDGFSKLFEDAAEVANTFYRRVLEDPLKAVEELPDFIEQARDVNPDRYFVEAVAGGPAAEFTGPVLGILGIVYPFLERDVRKKGLRNCMHFLDGLNYLNSQNNVRLINDPWLVADITINSNFWYWCGYREYCDLLGEHKRWSEFWQHTSSAASQFWLAYAVTRPKYSSLEIRRHFYQHFPVLLDRTKDAIAALIFDRAQRENEEKGVAIEDSVGERLSGFDPLLHEGILRKIGEKKWVKLPDAF